MTDATPRVGAPLLAAAQAQKHVTHNEALYQFDAFVCARFLDRDLAAPPASPSDGDTYLVATGGSGAWTGQDGKIAYSADGGWRFYAPFAGLVALVADENLLIAYSGSAWTNFVSLLSFQNLPSLGVNTTADSTNKLAAKTNAVLFGDLDSGSGGTGDIRTVLSKEASGNTASVLFQTGFSGRAEIGLTGDDDFHFKVSANGSTFTDAIRIAGASGLVTLASAAVGGGTIDGTKIGSVSPSTGSFTNLNSSGFTSLAGGVFVIQANGKVMIAPTVASSSMDNVVIGGTTPSSASFASLSLPATPNGSVATSLTGVGPAGAHTTVQEWFAVKNASGVTRYIPAF